MDRVDIVDVDGNRYVAVPEVSSLSGKMEITVVDYSDRHFLDNSRENVGDTTVVDEQSYMSNRWSTYRKVIESMNQDNEDPVEAILGENVSEEELTGSPTAGAFR